MVAYARSTIFLLMALSARGLEFSRMNFKSAQIFASKEPRDRTRVSEPDVPEVVQKAIRHEPKGDERLRLRDFVYVLLELRLALPRVAGRLLGFDHSQDGAVSIVQAVVREAVPGRLVVAGDRHL